MTQIEEKTCIVLIGSSGCGKSTLTNLLSKGNVKTSSSTDSCTKDCSIFSVDSTTTLMDTPGFEDSDKSFSDTEVIKLMTTKLGKSKSPKIKIIWCIRPNNKKTPSLQLQARLINALGNQIWSSVIIVCRKADMDEPDDNWQGAKQAALKYCSDIKHCLGITNVSVMSDKHKKKYKKRDFETRSEDGYYFADEIKKIIFKTLSKVPSTKAKLRKVYHHASSYRTHYGSLVKRYKNRCPGCSRSPDRFTYASRSISHHTWYCHTNGCNRKIYVGDTFYHCWPCCNRQSHSNDKFIIGCRGMTCTSCVEESYWEYNCCSSSEGSTGCVTSCCHRDPYSTLTSKCGDITYEPQGL